MKRRRQSAPPGSGTAALQRFHAWLCGEARSSSYSCLSWLFLRCLGAVFLIAMLSFWSQLDGLIGSDGILPAADYLERLSQHPLGVWRYWQIPTVFWINSSDAALHGICALGVVAAALLTVGVCPAGMLALLWLCYLSLSSVAQVFLGYQWDTLLLEVAVLAIFVAPWRLLPTAPGRDQPPWLAVWLLRCLLARLLFSSGAAKLSSGDTTWRQLTALLYHYETQPIPNAVAWYAHHLPHWFQLLSVLAMFVIQLLLPILMLTTRRLRLLACAGSSLLQLLIIATGNYCFFNLLALLLGLFLLDDRCLLSVCRAVGLPRPQPAAPPPRSPARQPTLATARGVCVVLAAVMTLPLAYAQMKRRAFRGELGPVLSYCTQVTAPWRTVNGYGLFANMTTARPEITIEGSRDGVTWQPYRFKWKPGALQRAPGQVAPHQPRLDWQMWFEALHSQRRQGPTGWFRQFLGALLAGRPAVLALLAENPFADAPPRYVRAILHDYHFTDAPARAATGDWWRQDNPRNYFGPAQLNR